MLQKYKDYLENAILYYFNETIFKQTYGTLPKFRYHTVKYCFDYLDKLDSIKIVELGTSRSFVDGRFKGCNSDDIKYWEPRNPEVWDWSAGCFTRLVAEQFVDKDVDFTTVDMSANHIERCKFMNKEFKNIKYVVSKSEDFLKNLTGKVDLLYLDTGDMTPIEFTANLHLNEAKLIVERDLVKKGGLILIDDVKNPTPIINDEDKSLLGKAKYSIPYFLKNGFELIIAEYQYILRKL